MRRTMIAAHSCDISWKGFLWWQHLVRTWSSLLWRPAEIDRPLSRFSTSVCWPRVRGFWMSWAGGFKHKHTQKPLCLMQVRPLSNEKNAPTKKSLTNDWPKHTQKLLCLPQKNTNRLAIKHCQVYHRETMNYFSTLLLTHKSTKILHS